MSVTPWPSLYEYAMAHRCTKCGADPGVECDAPGKNAQLACIDGISRRAGREPVQHDPVKRLHAVRQDAGMRHKRRDVGNAPWMDERVPGQRYDTLGGNQP